MPAQAQSMSRARGSAKTPAKQASPKTKPKRNSHFGLFVALGTIAVLAFAVWTYYPVAKQQYVSSRQRDFLAAELKATRERNARLQQEIDRLKTSEGVEDYARQQFGWVRPGENSVIVNGLTDDTESAPGTIKPIDPDAITIEESTFTRFLDAVFKVDTSSQEGLKKALQSGSPKDQ